MRSARPHRRSTRRPLASALSVGMLSLGLAACGDDVATAPIVPEHGRAESSEGRGYFQRYVAIGTSISAGVASDGLLGASQRMAWTAQLARLGHREVSLPLVAWPGCNSPLVAPIASGRRVNGQPATTFSCAPNEEGVVLPANVVAVDGARVWEALYGPDLADPQRVAKHSRILPVGMTQVSAMRLQNPKLVSVELGANELLGVRSGRVVEDVTVVSIEDFRAQYDQLLDEVAAVDPKAVVLAGLIDDVGNFPAFRSAAELFAQRAGLLNFGIVLTAGCGTTNAENLVFVPIKLPTLAAMAAATRAPQFWDCADAPGTDDYTLTPAVGSSRVDLQACKLEYSIVSPK